MDQQSKSSFVQGGDTSDTVTWSGHYSRLKSESSVKPSAEMRKIGANPTFPDKTKADPTIIINLMRQKK